MSIPSDDRQASADKVERPVGRLVKWRTGWQHEIERVECLRETAKCVWHVEDYFGEPREIRRDKMSSDWQYHDTWDAARDYLTQLAGRRLLSARRQLDTAQGFVDDVKGLRKPDGAQRRGQEE